jgi:phosphoribosylformylglycinamidine cyclo-ligase
MSARRAYTAAGVDVAAGERAVDLIRSVVEGTRRPESIGGLGGFAGAIGLPEGYREPVLVAATDGVGTKTAIASALGRFDTIGRDLVAMCADDVVCAGAEPLAFLDYVAVGRIEPGGVAELVEGIAAGCREAGCALVGGETAEHPGLIDAASFDLAGTCVGVVERSELLDGSRVASGLHANGFSLVRALLAEWDLDLATPYQAQLRRTMGEEAAASSVDAEPAHAMATLGEVLLTPTRIYARPVLHLRDRLEAAGTALSGIAHVTGGGLPGNIPRALPETLGARLDPRSWPVPSVLRLIGALGGLEEDELRATFNGGLGMVVVVPAAAVGLSVAVLGDEGIRAWQVGEVVPLDQVDGRRYVEVARA